jgi:hypothetical protein
MVISGGAGGGGALSNVESEDSADWPGDKGSHGSVFTAKQPVSAMDALAVSSVDSIGGLEGGSFLGTIISLSNFTTSFPWMGLKDFWPGLTVPGVTDLLGRRILRKLLVVEGGESIGVDILEQSLLNILWTGECITLSVLGTMKAVEGQEEAAVPPCPPAASGLGWMTGCGKDEAPPPPPTDGGPSKLLFSC